VYDPQIPFELGAKVRLVPTNMYGCDPTSEFIITGTLSSYNSCLQKIASTYGLREILCGASPRPLHDHQGVPHENLVLSTTDPDLLDEFERMLESSGSAPMADDESPSIIEKSPEEVKGPKDGDHVSLHEGHKIIPMTTGGVDYHFCSVCKVEVVKS